MEVNIAMVTGPGSRNAKISSEAVGGVELPQHKFLGVDKVWNLLQNATDGLDSVPIGVQENRYFIVKDNSNIDRRQNGKVSQYPDDCGAWDGKGSTNKAHYMVQPDGHLKKIEREKKNGEFYLLRKKNNRNYFPRVHPQPAEKDVIIVHRYYTYHTQNKMYKKCVTWIEGLHKSSPPYKYACYEYRIKEDLKTGKSGDAHASTDVGESHGHPMVPIVVDDEQSGLFLENETDISDDTVNLQIPGGAAPNSLLNQVPEGTSDGMNSIQCSESFSREVVLLASNIPQTENAVNQRLSAFQFGDDDSLAEQRQGPPCKKYRHNGEGEVHMAVDEMENHPIDVLDDSIGTTPSSSSSQPRTPVSHVRQQQNSQPQGKEHADCNTSTVQETQVALKSNPKQRGEKENERPPGTPTITLTAKGGKRNAWDNLCTNLNIPILGNRNTEQKTGGLATPRSSAVVDTVAISTIHRSSSTTSNNETVEDIQSTISNSGGNITSTDMVNDHDLSDQVYKFPTTVVNGVHSEHSTFIPDDPPDVSDAAGTQHIPQECSESSSREAVPLPSNIPQAENAVNQRLSAFQFGDDDSLAEQTRSGHFDLVNYILSDEETDADGDNLMDVGGMTDTYDTSQEEHDNRGLFDRNMDDWDEDLPKYSEYL